MGAYLADANSLLADSVKAVGAESAFTSIYKTTLAAHAILEKLHDDEMPSHVHASCVLQRIPIHVLTSQVQAAEVELRRAIELIFLTTYFSDHPVEWDTLVRNPQRSPQHERENPIAGNAYREPVYYRSYAQERFSMEPSGLASKAVDRLGVEYGNLSSAAHAPTATSDVSIRPAIGNMSSPTLAQFANRFKSVSSDLCVVAAAFSPARLDALEPMFRAWFDWLLGTEQAKKLRGGKFGLPELREE